MEPDLALQSQQVPFESRTEEHHIERARSSIRSPVIRRTSDRPQQHCRARIEEEALGGPVQSVTGVEILRQYPELPSHLCVRWRMLHRGKDVYREHPFAVERLVCLC